MLHQPRPSEGGGGYSSLRPHDQDEYDAASYLRAAAAMDIDSSLHDLLSHPFENETCDNDSTVDSEFDLSDTPPPLLVGDESPDSSSVQGSQSLQPLPDSSEVKWQALRALRGFVGGIAVVGRYISRRGRGAMQVASRFAGEYKTDKNKAVVTAVAVGGRGGGGEQNAPGCSGEAGWEWVVMPCGYNQDGFTPWSEKVSLPRRAYSLWHYLMG